MQNIRDIDLESNEISEIEDNALAGLPFTDLILSFNRLTALRRNTFAGASKLKVINLELNEISHIEEGTFNLPLLSRLYLQDNLLTTLPDKLFINAPLFNHLNLSANDFEEIPQALFEPRVQLESIVLDSNDMRGIKLHGLLKMPNAELVSLDCVGLRLPGVVPNRRSGKSYFQTTNL